MDGKEKTAVSLESSASKKEFRSPHAMLQWQWRSMLEELNELQRHLSDPTCPCTLADAGEYCGQKHALGLHTLAKETIAMAPEYQEMLEELADEALTQHEALNTRIVCNVHDPREKDTVLWSRQWRKRIEPIYYRQCKLKNAKMKQDASTLCAAINASIIDESDAGADYHNMAQEAKNAGLPDVAKTLNKISRQEAKHSDILTDISNRHCPGMYLKQPEPETETSIVEWSNGENSYFQPLDETGNSLGFFESMPAAADALKINGKCTDGNPDNCQFTITKTGKTKIVKKDVKQTEKTVCRATGIDELLEQKQSLLTTGHCFIKKKGNLRQEPTAVISGECSTGGCSLVVKGKIETPGQSTGYKELPETVKLVIDKLETRHGAPVTDKTYAPGISTNNRYDFKLVIKDADELIVSHDPFTFALNPKYTAKLQPRQRERLANQSQVRKIAANLDPEKLLLDTKAIDTGSPIINKNNLVLCGNGRVMALLLAAAEHPGNVAKYKLALREIAPQYRLSAESISKMKLPVLCRILLTETNEQAFAEECNARTTIEASAIEKARTDAEKITPAMLNSLDVIEGESIEDALRSRRNKPFVTSFISKLPENEQALLVDAKGGLNSDGVRRMGMAIFVSTFKGDTGIRLAGQFFEALDTNVKNAFNGILRSLGTLAQAENLVSSGVRDSRYAIGDDLAKAIGVFSTIKKEPGMTVSKYLAQQQMIERQLNPFQERILQTLDEYSRSAKRFGQILVNYAQSVIESAPPGQTSMLGDIRATKEELFENAVQKVQQETEAEKAARREPVATLGCAPCAALLSSSPEKFRDMADSMQKTIDEKRHPVISQQNLTARRSRIAAGMDRDADRLEEVQNILRGMADDIKSGTLPDILKNVTTRAQIERIAHWKSYSPPSFHKAKLKDMKKMVADNRRLSDILDILQNRVLSDGIWQVDLSNPDELKAVEEVIKIAESKGDSMRYVKMGIAEGKRLLSAGIDSKEKFEEAKQALQAYITGPSPEVLKEKARRELESKLIGAKIPGFFPTPRRIIDRMIEIADIKPGMSVLEPSAGKGDIADAIKEYCPDCKLTLVEYSYTLYEILKAKGFNPENDDFMTYSGGPFDRVIMNPPFEKEQDIDHVKHAFDLLKPGGRLVAIMSEHGFFADDKKAVDFRRWFDELDGESEKLAPGEFSGAGAFVPTMVATRLVTINRPVEVSSQKEKYFNGDKIIETGVVTPDNLIEFIYLEGPKKGQKGYRLTDKEHNAMAERKKQEWREQQEQFKKLSKPTPMCQYGDWCVSPDGKEGIMRGSGGMGSNRVQLVDGEGNFKGYYNREELRPLQAVGKLPIPQAPYAPGQQIQLFGYEWLSKKLTGCNLSEQDQLTIFGWRPLREFITLAAIGKKTTVNVCAAGMVPGAYQIVIRTGEGQPITPIMEAAKKVPGMKRVFSKEGGLTYEILVPDESGQALTWKPQEISTKPARRESAKQAAMFADPLLSAIGCTIGIGCLAQGKPKFVCNHSNSCCIKKSKGK